jgi:hypothetical protein
MKYLLVCLLLFGVPTWLEAQSTGAELIDASIRFHDPEGLWSTANLVLGFNDTRPGKEDRPASFSFDNTTGTACVTRLLDGKKIIWHITDDQCSFEIDGRTEITQEEIEQYRLTEERGITMRNYYLYLWGLPMKLKDPGTKVQEQILDKEFNGQMAKVAKVTYEEAVGSDIWYFYFAPETYELIGYQFYHDEEKGDGEYITLTGLEEINAMRIPKNRTWYTNPDSTLLGTDNLIHSYSVHRH